MGEQRNDSNGNDADTGQNESSGKYYHGDRAASADGIPGIADILPVLCATVGNCLFLSHISLEDRECAWILAGAAGVDGSGGECGRTNGGNGTGNEHCAGAEYLTGAGHYDRAEYSARE